MKMFFAASEGSPLSFSNGPLVVIYCVTSKSKNEIIIFERNDTRYHPTFKSFSNTNKEAVKLDNKFSHFRFVSL